MEGYRVGNGKAGEGGNLVDDAMGVVGGGADEEDRVWVYEAAEFGNGDAVGGCGTGDGVEFDVEVGGGLVECRVGS